MAITEIIEDFENGLDRWDVNDYYVGANIETGNWGYFDGSQQLKVSCTSSTDANLYSESSASFHYPDTSAGGIVSFDILFTKINGGEFRLVFGDYNQLEFSIDDDDVHYWYDSMYDSLGFSNLTENVEYRIEFEFYPDDGYSLDARVIEKDTGEIWNSDSMGSINKELTLDSIYIESSSYNGDMVYYIDDITQTVPPSEPTNVSASLSNNDSYLSWDAEYATSFNIYRSESSGSTQSDYTQIDSIEGNTTSYTDSTVSNGEKYYYRIASSDQ